MLCLAVAPTVVILGIGLLSALVYGEYLKHTAQTLLDEVKALKLGVSDFRDAARIADKYQRFRVEGDAAVPASLDPAENRFPGSICNSDRCFYYLVLDNRPLSTFHLLKPSRFTAAFAVLHNRVQYTETTLYGGPFGLNGGIVEQLNPRNEAAVTYSFPTPVGKPYLLVRLTPSAPASIRDRAFALNMNCFVGFAPCNAPCDYLPLAWKDWEIDLSNRGWVESLRRFYPMCH